MPEAHGPPLQQLAGRQADRVEIEKIVEGCGAPPVAEPMEKDRAAPSCLVIMKLVHEVDLRAREWHKRV